MSLSASSNGEPATKLRLAASLAAVREPAVVCAKLNSFAPARAAASVDVRSSVRTSCIQATLIANAAMMMHNGKQTAINTSIAPRREARRFGLGWFLMVVNLVEGLVLDHHAG